MLGNLKLITILFLMIGTYVAQAQPVWNLGLGLEARGQKEVNPDYVEGRVRGQIFAQMLYPHWGAHLETGVENQKSESGGLEIESRTINTSLWARYRFWEEKAWRPFLAAGAGMNFDRVTSTFNSTATNVSNGQRPFAGLGVGFATTFWNHLLLDLETRTLITRDTKSPTFSAILRLGYSF